MWHIYKLWFGKSTANSIDAVKIISRVGAEVSGIRRGPHVRDGEGRVGRGCKRGAEGPQRAPRGRGPQSGAHSAYPMTRQGKPYVVCRIIVALAEWNFPRRLVYFFILFSRPHLVFRKLVEMIMFPLVDATAPATAVWLTLTLLCVSFSGNYWKHSFGGKTKMLTERRINKQEENILLFHLMYLPLCSV